MGRKNKNIDPKSKQASQKKLQKEPEEFQLNLKALDGYDLPDSEEKQNDVQQPKTKKLKQSRPQVLGIDYREREEKRLEQLLFGELIQKFEQDSDVKLTELKQNAVALNTGKKGKQKGSVKEKEIKKATTVTTNIEKDALPEDLYGDRLGLSASRRQVAWVDEDDDELK